MLFIRKYIPVILLSMMLFACGDGDKIPGQYLSREEMKDLLRDMAIADSYGNEQQMQTGFLPNSDSLRQERIKVYYKQILDLHKVGVKQFMDSYRYYEGHPSRLKEVLQMVQSDLAVRKQKLGEPVDVSLPVRYRVKTIFPYADSVLLLPKVDTTRPFVKRSH